MSQEYTISKVSPEVKNWESSFGQFVTYHVKFEGSDEVIQLNKKQESPKPNEGDKVYGTITETEYGNKFKAEKNPNGGYSGGGAKQYTPRDDSAIKAQWALGTASRLVEKFDPSLIQQIATDLFHMVEEVKNSTAKKEWIDPEVKAKILAAKETNKELDAEMKSLIDSEEETEIDISDIPF